MRRVVIDQRTQMAEQTAQDALRCKLPDFHTRVVEAKLRTQVLEICARGRIASLSSHAFGIGAPSRKEWDVHEHAIQQTEIALRYAVDNYHMLSTHIDAWVHRTTYQLILSPQQPSWKAQCSGDWLPLRVGDCMRSSVRSNIIFGHGLIYVGRGQVVGVYQLATGCIVVDVQCLSTELYAHRPPNPARGFDQARLQPRTIPLRLVHRWGTCEERLARLWRAHQLARCGQFVYHWAHFNCQTVSHWMTTGEVVRWSDEWKAAAYQIAPIATVTLLLAIYAVLMAAECLRNRRRSLRTPWQSRRRAKVAIKTTVVIGIVIWLGFYAGSALSSTWPRQEQFCTTSAIGSSASRQRRKRYEDVTRCCHAHRNE